MNQTALLYMSNYCMQAERSVRDLHAYFASPSADADDVRVTVLDCDCSLLKLTYQCSSFR
jgi:hypothetical protein